MILILDDDQDLIEILKIILINEFSEIAFFSNPKNLIKFAKNIDNFILVSDYKLGGDFNVNQLIEELSEKNFKTIVTSGMSRPHNDKFDSFLLKPFNFEELITEIKKVS